MRLGRHVFRHREALLQLVVGLGLGEVEFRPGGGRFGRDLLGRGGNVVARRGRLGRGRAALVLQRVVQVGFAVGQVVDFLVAGLLDQNVRRDAEALDRAAGRRVVARRGQAKGAVVAHRDDGLHRAFAEAAGAEDDGAAMVLQRAGDDLARRGGAAVDQHDQRQAAGHVGAAGVPALALVGVAGAGGDDLAVGDEVVADVDSGIEQAAGVVAQVEDEALEVVVLGFQLLDRLLQLRLALFVEAGEADIADVAVKRGFHHLDVDDLAGHRHVDRLVHAFALDVDGDGAAGGAAHAVNRVVQREAFDGLTVEREDEVARLHAGALGGGVVDRADDFHQAAVGGDFKAEPAELALGGDLHVAVLFGVHVAAVRVEAGDHAVERVVDQFAVVHGGDVVGADLFEDVAEESEQVVGVLVLGSSVVGEGCGEVQRWGDAVHDRARDNAGDEGASEQQASTSCHSLILFSWPRVGPVRAVPSTSTWFWAQ